MISKEEVLAFYFHSKLCTFSLQFKQSRVHSKFKNIKALVLIDLYYMYTEKNVTKSAGNKERERVRKKNKKHENKNSLNLSKIESLLSYRECMKNKIRFDVKRDSENQRNLLEAM